MAKMFVYIVFGRRIFCHSLIILGYDTQFYLVVFIATYVLLPIGYPAFRLLMLFAYIMVLRRIRPQNQSLIL
jgi:hypothetical protein